VDIEIMTSSTKGIIRIGIINVFRGRPGGNYNNNYYRTKRDDK